MPELDDQAQTRLAMAALFSALVRALERRDVIARSDFTVELDKVYREIRDYPTNQIRTLETALLQQLGSPAERQGRACWPPFVYIAHRMIALTENR
jgi:hypothetical protein